MPPTTHQALSLEEVKRLLRRKLLQVKAKSQSTDERKMHQTNLLSDGGISASSDFLIFKLLLQ